MKKPDTATTKKVFAILFAIVLILLYARILYSYSIENYSAAEDENIFNKELLPTNTANRTTRTKPYLSDKEIERLNKEQAIIDMKYCGGPCRFMNLLYVREQETRAQHHVRQFAFTAGKLNRTLILPNVSGSRLGACLPYDFEYYYDIKWAKKNSNQYFKYITMTDFKSWLEERKNAQVPVVDQVLSIYDIAEHNPPISKQVLHCFSGYTKPKSAFNQVMAWDINWRFQHQREGQLIDFSRGAPVTANDDQHSNETLYDNDDIEVLQVEIHKANPFSSIPESNVPIPYSPQLVEFADITAQSLGSYIAVHWRMERANNAANLIHCAEHLVSLLEEKNMNKSNVFLLTDYPHTFTAQQQNLAIEQHATQEELLEWLQSTSDTFFPQNFTSSHHQAIQYLFQHHPFNLFETTMQSMAKTPKNWKLMPIPDALKRVNVLQPPNGVDMIDSGWLGILDKLMAIRSHDFFAGNGDICGRGRSTFTKQIVKERKLMGKKSVHYFGQ